MCSSRRKALLAAASCAAREQLLNARKDDLRNPDPESGLLRETRAPPVCPRAAWRPVRVLRGPRQGGEGSCVNCAQSGLPAAWPPGPRALLRSQPVPALPGRPLSSLPAAEGPGSASRRNPRGRSCCLCPDAEGCQRGGGRRSAGREWRGARAMSVRELRGKSHPDAARCGSSLKIGPGGAGRGAGAAEVWAG